jgi:hypothetical protein
MTAMIEGQPVRNAPTMVAVPMMPVSKLNACSAYTTCVQVTRESDARFHSIPYF